MRGNSNSGTDTSDPDARLEPALLRAVASNDVEALVRVLEHARRNGQFGPRFLLIGLLRSVERGCVATTRRLLQVGANPDLPSSNKRPQALLRAIHRENHQIIHLLLDHGASLEIVDKNGCTPLMTAAWKSSVQILQLLIQRGANIHARDLRKRNALHSVAANKEYQGRSGLDTVQLLLKNDCNPNEQDELGRTPLHWACAMGNDGVAELLLTSPGMRCADINATDLRGRTALHIAVDHGHYRTVKLLLTHSASVNDFSDGGWTPLHCACQKGNEMIVRLLLRSGAHINRQLLNGVAPLHLAVQHGHIEVVACLLERLDLKRRLRDKSGKSPFLYAALFKHKDILHLLAPFNQVDTLGESYKAACTEFDATIVDFGNFHNVRRVLRRSIFDLIYRRDQENPRKHAMVAAPDCGENGFRWIHLPANNIMWVEALITKVFIEKGAQDVQAFGSLENSLSYHQQGHSQFMMPLGNTSQKVQQENSAVGQETGTDVSAGLFIPYLHFETAEGVQKMQEAIQRSNQILYPPKSLCAMRTRDDLLVDAHVPSASLTLHLRQTLDQYFYPHSNTERRDKDQVVYRYQTRGPGRKRILYASPKLFMVDRLWMWILGEDLIITCFPQRWNQPSNDPFNVLDRIIEDISSKLRSPITSRYDLATIIIERCLGVFDNQHGDDDEYRFFDMFEYSINIANDREVTFFTDFYQASKQASDWLKSRHRPKGLFSQLHSTFHRGAAPGDPYSDEDNHHYSESSPRFVDQMLDIGEETDLLAEVKDIRDELNIIRSLLEHQTHVLSRFQQSINSIIPINSQGTACERLRDRQIMVDLRLQHINRMDQQAERVYHSMVHLLDLKQKQANAFEARFARDQAEGTARQGKIIMVFTIVTVVFLPLSFLTSFFAIDMREFSDLTIPFVAKYTFGIGFVISVPLILVALSVDEIGGFFRHSRDWLFRRRRRTSRRDRAEEKV
ncbi:ankyrin repeat-containing domain protein [Aspergillus ambiguus]|uniref:ankyrin repeat-containing domain protein n=1 Tax=Aspergillus ambiguus TaxID=176160 RepID=UPI003CCD5933